MSNENWTKGEWVASKPLFGRIDIYSNHSVGGRECMQGRQSIAITHHTSKKENPEYAEMFLANAHLIAAAPKLYEALNELLEIAKQERWAGSAVCNAMNALAAARGELAHKNEKGE